MDVESDGRFAALRRIGLVQSDTSQSFSVVRLVERVRQRRHGHPRLCLANIRRVGLVVVADELRFAEQPLDVGRWIAAATQTANGSLLAVGQRQIGAVYHGSELEFELRRIGRNCGNNGATSLLFDAHHRPKVSHTVKGKNYSTVKQFGAVFGTFDKFFPEQL